MIVVSEAGKKRSENSMSCFFSLTSLSLAAAVFGLSRVVSFVSLNGFSPSFLFYHIYNVLYARHIYVYLALYIEFPM